MFLARWIQTNAISHRYLKLSVTLQAVHVIGHDQFVWLSLGAVQRVHLLPDMLLQLLRTLHRQHDIGAKRIALAHTLAAQVPYMERAAFGTAEKDKNAHLVR